MMAVIFHFGLAAEKVRLKGGHSVGGHMEARRCELDCSGRCVIISAIELSLESVVFMHGRRCELDC
jgi:hypothetical protein